MNRLETIVYNEGERLVPYVSHDEYELIRHRSSYAFFRSVIAHDVSCFADKSRSIDIVDLGFGSGYGCSLLASLPNSRIVGVDNTLDCQTYAKKTYNRANVSYHIADLTEYIPEMPCYDYVLSRGVLEHIPNGLDLIKTMRFRRRLIIDVPYKEEPGNDHHIIHGIDESSFDAYEDCEIFYEDLAGRIYTSNQKPEKPNLILLALRDQSLPRICEILDFPIDPCTSNAVEFIKPSPPQIIEHFFSSEEEFTRQALALIKNTSSVLDIGPGIYPMTYFRPQIHILAEPCEAYQQVLQQQYSINRSKIILRSKALETLSAFGDKSVDSIFMLDVIEHLSKEIGLKCLKEMERVAREQIIVFTPYGFMPQESSEDDAWNLPGGSYQQHISGWTPSDFDSHWLFLVCEECHKCNAKNEPFERPYGAFYAIKNLEPKTSSLDEPHKDIKEKYIYPFQQEYMNLESSYLSLQTAYSDLELKLSTLQARRDILASKHLYRVYTSTRRVAAFARKLIASCLPLRSSEVPTVNIASIFTDIYLNNTWGSDSSHSGCGSDLVQTETIRAELPAILSSLNIRSILDIPCGDFYWMRHVQLDKIKYIGADIVAEIISNNHQYASELKSFKVLDITSDPLPHVDLVFCRDCLVHLSYADIWRALENIKASGAKYLMTTFFSRRASNSDIVTGQWRPLNLEVKPFNFPPPLIVLNEQCTEYGSDWNDKSLGVWEVARL